MSANESTQGIYFRGCFSTFNCKLRGGLVVSVPCVLCVLCLQVRRSPQLVSSLLQHLAPQLGSLKPNELACTLWCLSRLNMQPPAGWLEALFAATRPTLPALRGDEVAVLVRGLAGVQVGRRVQRVCQKMFGYKTHVPQGVELLSGTVLLTMMHVPWQVLDLAPTPPACIFILFWVPAELRSA